MNDVLERDDNHHLEERVGRIFDDRMEQMMDQITNRVNTLLDERERERRSRSSVAESIEGGSEYSDEAPPAQRRPPPVYEGQRAFGGDDRRWESGIRTDIPEFHGGL